ncbi:hypothetical protein AAFF_G00231910 [Aldrovandia affinis]|uniref:Uncharacterized protein n=1 Tax=Aldrovandia affinis TaxID=143900 RepID=A0AAD7RF37_9TELE|nr:hypothetical protein AAFF_G00231910 [Aldrovandia affinis]
MIRYEARGSGQATDTTGADTSVETETADSKESASPPREKKTAMAELFRELFMTQEPGSKSVAKIAEEEIISFKAVDIPLDADPLECWKTNGHL